MSAGLLAAANSGPAMAIIMAVLLFAIFVLLTTLIWTRWGQAQPLSKCVVLSLLAHVLLLIYAYSTQILYGPPGSWTGQTVRVRLHDAADDEEAATLASADPMPWQQAGLADTELNPQSESATELVSENAKTTPQPPPLLQEQMPPPESVVAENSAPQTNQDEQIQPKADMPDLAELLPDREAPAEDPAAADPVAPPTNPLRSSEPATDLATTDADPNPTVESVPPNPIGQFVSATVPTPPRRLGDGQDVPGPLTARVAADRLKVAQPFGATPQTEAAVAAALDWLAGAQSTDGRWDADAYGAGRETQTLGHDRRGAGANADMGISGLALLAFLGAGETHLAGKHRENVQHGLEFLLASQAADGNLAGNAELFASMYCHGIATLALSEAYALSGDERLMPGLRKALQYTIGAQHPAGGWRYQPLDQGDMSQFGWQLMALKSAELGGVPIPSQTRTRMLRFLQSCSSGKSRGLASYRPGERPSGTMTAEALVCRYFLAAENSAPVLDEAAAYILKERPGAGPTNFYYWYYGTLALFQRQGDEWERWNAALQHQLLSRQRWDGASSGSWDPDDIWGGYGGRIYSTALATLSLEVYYRYLPLHGRGADDSRLTDRPWLPGLPR